MAPSTDAGGLIDDEGNLFGLVNVVDALVILLALAVLVAGAGLLLSSGDQTTPATTYATIDLGTQPEYIVSAFDEGDTYNPDTRSSVTITDIHLAPQGNQTRVVVRTELRGPVDNDTLAYNKAPPRLGRKVGINTTTYNSTGRITDVGDGPSLDTATTTVVLRDTVSAADANAVTPGDEISVGGRTVATVEDVAVYPTTQTNRRQILVEATLSTYTQQGTDRFGGATLRPGQQVTLPASTYTIEGHVERVGGGLESDTLTNRTVTLEARRVQPEVAQAVRSGQTERAGGRTMVYVTDVTTEPTPVIGTAQNGSVVVGDHPTLRDVTLTTELRVRETPEGVEFRGTRLQYGSTVVLDLGPVTVNTTVTDIEG